MGLLGEITKESFLVGLLLFAMGFATAFLAFYIWKRIRQANPDAADAIGLVA
jgi:hypothetical protein